MSKRNQKRSSKDHASSLGEGQLDKDHHQIFTTSGSENEIEQRVLMKGNVMAARNSLLDFAQYNSWIKKSNYEGIFNAIIVIFLFLLFHKPLVSTIYILFSQVNWIRMGRPFEPDLINRIIDQFSKIYIANIYFFLFAFRYKTYINLFQCLFHIETCGPRLSRETFEVFIVHIGIVSFSCSFCSDTQQP